MAVVNSIKKEEDIVCFLEHLAKSIKESSEVDYAKASVVHETREVPTKFCFEKKPSGWVDVNLEIRFLKR